MVIIECFSTFYFAIYNLKFTDDKEKLQLEVSVDEYLIEGIKNCSSVLRISENENLSIVFDLIGLWFENEESKRVNDIMKTVFENTASFKFVPLCHQIFSRLNSTDDRNQLKMLFLTTLNRLVFNLCRDHPFHALSILFSMMHDTNDISRANEAKKILNHVASVFEKPESNYNGLIKNMESLVNAYIGIFYKII